MARGAGRKAESANGPAKTRVSQRSRNHLSREISKTVHQDEESERKATTEKEKIPLNYNSVNHKPGNSHLPPENKQHNKEVGLSPTKCDKKMRYESSCTLTRKSQVLNAENKLIVKSQISKKCDTLSQVHSKPRIVSKECSSEPKPKCDSDFVANSGQKCFFDIDNSTLILEMMLHANTILYGLLSISTNHFTKVGFKLPVAVDPFMVKIFYTLLLGFLADFISPLSALLIPQVTCLVTGLLLSLQVFPQYMAFIAVYLPQLNSGLIGTQLLMKLSKPSESFAAGLSRINCFYCLTDLFSPWLLKVVTRNIGFTLSYQIMTFSSFLVLVGVLYLFHTNHRKDAYHHHEMSFFKSLLIKLFFSIPVALLLPRFQYLLRRVGNQNTFGLVTAAVLIVQQVVLVPPLQSLYNCRKIVCVSAAVLALLFLLLMVTEIYVGLILLIMIYGIAGVVQNFVVSLFVNSYPGMSGILLATNLILYLGVRYFTAQITEGMSSNCFTEEECLNLTSSTKNLMNGSFFKNLSSWFIRNEVFDSENVVMNMVYLMSSISSAALFLITKYI